MAVQIPTEYLIPTVAAAAGGGVIAILKNIVAETAKDGAKKALTGVSKMAFSQLTDVYSYRSLESMTSEEPDVYNQSPLYKTHNADGKSAAFTGPDEVIRELVSTIKKTTKLTKRQARKQAGKSIQFSDVKHASQFLNVYSQALHPMLLESFPKLEDEPSNSATPRELSKQHNKSLSIAKDGVATALYLSKEWKNALNGTEKDRAKLNLSPEKLYQFAYLCTFASKAIMNPSKSGIMFRVNPMSFLEPELATATAFIPRTESYKFTSHVKLFQKNSTITQADIDNLRTGNSSSHLAQELLSSASLAVNLLRTIDAEVTDDKIRPDLARLDLELATADLELVLQQEASKYSKDEYFAELYKKSICQITNKSVNVPRETHSDRSLHLRTFDLLIEALMPFAQDQFLVDADEEEEEDRLLLERLRSQGVQPDMFSIEGNLDACRAARAALKQFMTTSSKELNITVPKTVDEFNTQAEKQNSCVFSSVTSTSKEYQESFKTVRKKLFNEDTRVVDGLRKMYKPKLRAKERLACQKMDVQFFSTFRPIHGTATNLLKQFTTTATKSR